jgi:X-Pro dipeptidyl-peptidase
VQRENQSSATTYADWPDPAARDVALRLSASDPVGPGDLVTGGPRGRSSQSLVDSGRTIGPDALVTEPDTASPNRLVYRSPVLAREVRLSGRPELRLRMSIDNRADANLTGYLVDYGPPGATGVPFVVTRGWLDPQNRDGASRTRPVTPGRMCDYRWTLEPKDYVFPAGHRIGVVVFSTDQEYTLLPLGGTRLTVQPWASEIRIPVVGGRSGSASELSARRRPGPRSPPVPGAPPRSGPRRVGPPGRPESAHAPARPTGSRCRRLRPAGPPPAAAG